MSGKRFTLVGQDGNAFNLMGYTAECMKEAGMRDQVDEMFARATSGNYNNLICVCNEYVEKANEALGLTEDDEEDDYE